MIQKKGFTLIELLIVIVLVGIMSTMVMVSIGSGDQHNWQRQEAERLMQLLELASQESIIQGEPLAIELFGNGYRFMFPGIKKWEVNITDAIFRPRELHARLFLELEMDQKTLVLNKKGNGLLNPEPQIVLTPDSGTPSFQINIGMMGSEEAFIIMNTPKKGLLLTTKSAHINAYPP